MATRQQLRVAILDLASRTQSSGGGQFHPNNIIHANGPLDMKMRELRGGAALTEEELVEASLAFDDLHRAGFVAHTFRQGALDRGWFVVSRAGREYLANEATRPFFAVRLHEIIADQEVITRCEPNFLNGDYDLAVFAAFKAVEERLRARAGLPAEVLGTDLVNRTLSPTTGILVYPHAQTSSESEGLHRLFLGAVGSFKNPSSHRTVAYSDAAQAHKTLCLADLLLKYIAELRPRQP